MKMSDKNCTWSKEYGFMVYILFQVHGTADNLGDRLCNFND